MIAESDGLVAVVGCLPLVVAYRWGSVFQTAKPFELEAVRHELYHGIDFSAVLGLVESPVVFYLFIGVSEDGKELVDRDLNRGIF